MFPVSEVENHASAGTGGPIANKINLRFLLINGKKHDFVFGPKENVANIKKRLFENWPTEWTSEAVQSVDEIRILYGGRFIADYETLDSMSFGLMG